MTQKLTRIGARKTWICVWEMKAYIAHCGCPEQSVGKRMERHISVAVAEKTLCMRYFDTAEYQRASVGERMYVIAETASYIR